MGKANSKLKKKNRTQSMAWSYRFPSVTSLSMRRKPASIGPQMSIKQWLAILNLSQYEHLFTNFNGVEDVMRYTEEDLKDLGIKSEAHLQKIINSLVALKSKYEHNAGAVKPTLRADFVHKGGGGGGGNNKNDKIIQRHSVAVDPTTLINHLPNESDILVLKNFNQSKSLCDIKMEASNVEPDADPIQLKKILEWELSLDGRDLRSHAWYHGSIPRVRAEEIVGEKDGDFLVRDCTSQPGNYVLSCRSKAQNLHFVINKIVLQPDTVYERVQYRFEEDGYDTVPDLITFYVGSGKPVTTASGAKIQTPRNRLYPLSFYANKYELQQNHVHNNNNLMNGNRTSSPGGIVNSSSIPNHSSSYSSSYLGSPANSPPRLRRGDTIPKLPTKKQRSLSLLTNLNGRTDSIHVNGTDSKNIDIKFLQRQESFSNSLPRNGFTSKMQIVSNNSRNSRTSSSSENGRTGTIQDAPPKPSRSYCSGSNGGIEDDYENGENGNSEIGRKNSLYHTSGSDSGNGSGDSVQSSILGDRMDCLIPRRSSGGVIIKNPRYFCQQQTMSNASSLTTLKPAYSYDTFFEDTPPTGGVGPPTFQLPSVFDLENFHTLLLPIAENKPLDGSALEAIHMLLQDSGSRILANHITRTDLELIVNDECYSRLLDSSDFPVAGGKYGIELCVLPHGHQLRLDLIERTECMKLVVAITLLTCDSDSDRAEVLNKWIEVAIDTKTALGNLFGFCSIMMGLCMPQIERLSSTWHILRQKYTDSAFNFEAKLRPTLKNMNECTNPLAPNTTIPHLMPIMLLHEQTLDDISGNNNQSDKQNLITSWENSSNDLGLSTLFSHLDNARQYCQLIPTFKRNSEIVLSDSKIEDLLMDMFRTEFHLKFLWGCRGAFVSSEERYSKFQQVLNVMSEKCEPSIIPADCSVVSSVTELPDIRSIHHSTVV